MSATNVELNKQYWDNFYKNSFKHTPSQFCASVVTDLRENSVILDLGSGNGRDSLYFSSQGHIVVGIDLSREAIASCKSEAERMMIHHAVFINGDITNVECIKNAVDIARSKVKDTPITYYSRFVVHSLDDSQEEAFLSSLGKQMVAGESVYFEFRSKEDANLCKHFGGHYRRYVDVDKFTSTLTANGLHIIYKIVGQGMARFREEDPFVARIVAQKATS